jgi:hypothetical protein
MNRIIIGTLALGAVGALAFLATRSEPKVVLECRDSTGQRVGWAEIETECPTGSAATKYEVPELCGESCMPCEPPPCEPGTSGCQDPVPVEYLCCLPVCGEQVCEVVNEATACDANNLIFDCQCPYQHPDGSIECMEC